MRIRLPKPRALFTYLAAYFFALSTILRTPNGFRGEHFAYPIIIPLAVFFLLLLIEPFLSRISHRYTHIYLAVQTIIVTSLLFLPPHADYISVLFFVLTLQAMHVLPQRHGIYWVVGFTIIMAVAMLHAFGPQEGLAFMLNYFVAYFIAAALVTITRQAEQAREETQRLLGELQDAHNQLQVYADQIEVLTAEQERNRLARNLHDSVTQTIFSMTLTAEAARILIDRDSILAGAEVDKLILLSKSALNEMRSLIHELRPPAMGSLDLIPALRQHFKSVEQFGLSVDFSVSGDCFLNAEQEAALFYVIQEALNNIVKHAQVSQAEVELTFHPAGASISIADLGTGFDPSAMVGKQGSIGLASMQERIDLLDGTLRIDSSPGRGTTIQIEVPCPEVRTDGTQD